MSTKSWEHPWSTEEIIENSANWSLAGDVALLHTLQAFSQNLLSNANKISDNLNNLNEELEKTDIRLSIARNQFQALKNSQFIESRVYEDDEEDFVEKSTLKTEKNEDVIEGVKAAALKGVRVMEEFFDRVEVNVSDSEDDDIDIPNFILRPKDLYLERPLPYVIGTDEWYQKNHVGLDSSDSETEEKVSESYSESNDSDSDIVQDRLKLVKPESSSESKNFSDSENSLPRSEISTKNFAEQLAQKLGTVERDEEPPINTRPIQKTIGVAPRSEERKKIDLFDSDDENDLFKPSEIKIPEKSKLFDEDLFKDDLFSSNLFADIPPEAPPTKTTPTTLFDTTPPEAPPTTLFDATPPEDNLFADEPISDDLFQAPPKLFDTTPLFTDAPIKSNDLFNATPPEDNLFTDEPIKSNHLFNATPPDDNLFTNEPTNDDLFEEPIKKISLFDTTPPEDNLFADDPITSDDLFQAPPTKTPSLFDSSPPRESVAPPTKSQFTSLFSSSPPTDDLFANNPPIASNFTPSPAFFSSTPPDDIFSEPITNDNESLFDNIDHVLVENEPMSKVSAFASTPPDLIVEATPIVTSPSKVAALKQNLKINVGALMPGSRAIKIDDSDRVEVLQSVTKDRARVPLKRRPSTRRGRKEALKQSNSDFKLVQDENAEEEKVVAPSSSALFDDDDTDDLFSKKTVVPTKGKQKSLLFDDDDDDDDIFKDFSANKVGTKSAEKKIPKASVKKLENTKSEGDPLSAMLK